MRRGTLMIALVVLAAGVGYVLATGSGRPAVT